MDGVIDTDDFFEYEYDVIDLLENSDRCFVCDEKKRLKARGLCPECTHIFTISKTNAKTQYKLTDADIADLHSYTMRTQWGSGAMYYLFEIRLRAIEKHYKILCTSKEEYAYYVNLFLEEKEKKAIDRQAALERKQLAREEELRDELNKYGIKLRSDSILCRKYVEGSKLKLVDVVTEMVLMDFVYKHCNYADKIMVELDLFHRSIREDREFDVYYEPKEIATMIESVKRKLKKRLIRKYCEQHGFKKLPKILRKKYPEFSEL